MTRRPRPTRAALGRRYERVLKSVPLDLKKQIDQWAEAWLRTKFTPGLELRREDPGPFNWPITVFSEWRGKAFYLCARYRTPTGRIDDEFVVRSARMTMTGFGRFELAFLRHTGRWFTVERGLTVTQCLREIEGNEIFWPIT